ncbi:unnamed protein product, partial [Mesorhabditis belari]|uniref:eIF3h C-terminal domain-containing protein n=1 Tax=Mesorhabditis belari TaxID=2138241 RepID=A0AAF3EXF3_9BILA
MIAELAIAPGKLAEKISAHLELGIGNKKVCCKSLEKCVRGMMPNIDELNKSISAYTKYVAEKQRHDANVYNMTQKRELENEQRRQRGEPLMSFDDIKRLKGPQLQTKSGIEIDKEVESFLLSADTESTATPSRHQRAAI